VLQVEYLYLLLVQKWSMPPLKTVCFIILREYQHVSVRDFFLVLADSRALPRSLLYAKISLSTILVVPFLVDYQQTHVPALATQLYGRTEKSSLFRGQACTHCPFEWNSRHSCLVALLGSPELNCFYCGFVFLFCGRVLGNTSFSCESLLLHLIRVGSCLLAQAFSYTCVLCNCSSRFPHHSFYLRFWAAVLFLLFIFTYPMNGTFNCAAIFGALRLTCLQSGSGISCR